MCGSPSVSKGGTANVESIALADALAFAMVVKSGHWKW